MEPDLFERACQAIKARVEGVWDDPALEEVGAMTTDTNADIDTIIDHYTGGD